MPSGKYLNMAIKIEKLPPEIRNNPAKLGNVLLADKYLSMTDRVKAVKQQREKISEPESGDMLELFKLIDLL